MVSKAHLIEQFANSREKSSFKFYKFLDVEFHVYEMSTPIGKAMNYQIILTKVLMKRHYLSLKIIMIIHVFGVAFLFT